MKQLTLAAAAGVLAVGCGVSGPATSAPDESAIVGNYADIASAGYEAV